SCGERIIVAKPAGRPVAHFSAIVRGFPGRGRSSRLKPNGWRSAIGRADALAAGKSSLAFLKGRRDSRVEAGIHQPPARTDPEAADANFDTDDGADVDIAFAEPSDAHEDVGDGIDVVRPPQRRFEERAPLVRKERDGFGKDVRIPPRRHFPE